MTSQCEVNFTVTSQCEVNFTVTSQGMVNFTVTSHCEVNITVTSHCEDRNVDVSLVSVDHCIEVTCLHLEVTYRSQSACVSVM